MKRLNRLIGALLATGALSLTTTAQADDFYVDVTNATGYSIYYLYVSPCKAKDWEEDVLGNDTMSHKETQRVNLRGYQSSCFDIQARDEDGDTYSFFGVDVASEDLLITHTDLDR